MASREQLAVRRAVRDALTGLDPARVVLAACSGGADSLALAAALGWICRRDGRPAGGVVVDHGLQTGSAERARETAVLLVEFGLDPVEVVQVRVTGRGRGPEGNARAARYDALDAAGERHDASTVLLGHTRDDQAENVLLGLARGSGARSLAGMPAVSGRYRRPLLDLPREVVRAALPPDVKPWEDPHNADPAFARARVRHRVLPVLEAELGPGVAEALSRTGALLRADADALDAWADGALADAKIEVTSVGTERHQNHLDHVRLDVVRLAELPQAVRTRVIRRAAVEAGCSSTDLTAAHVNSVDALITHWHGQRGIDLPGPVRAARTGLVLRFVPAR
ncbi:MAG TPA: tRNA lysidine(34) synthetase TilS [Jiangellales bacterium]|nr:tRNA lysidine(34) synthetase TilS [Jiangellales bacterium]